MKLNNILTLFLLMFSGTLSAQTIKTKVVVIGGTTAGTGAAIQSAHSGVKTLFISETDQPGEIKLITDTSTRIGLENDWLKLLKKSKISQENQVGAASVLKGWTDTTKNLTVLTKTGVKSIKQSGKSWRIRLTNGKKVKAKLIVDASENGETALKAGAKTIKTVLPASTLNTVDLYSDNRYRSSVVTRHQNGNFTITPIGSFISAGTENLVLAKPNTLLAGQAAGATAAYCAFFNTSTKNINIRAVQGELFAYKSWLIPFADVTPADSNFAAVQHIGATGILKGTVKNGKLYFNSDSTVSVEEISASMKNFFTRSLLWFQDHKQGILTLNDALSLIEYSGTRGEELKKETEESWSASFSFKSSFDLKRPVTRKEFSVLLDAYLKPFNVKVNPAGKLLK